MGTTGGGRLRDYQPLKKAPSGKKCERKLTSVPLQEVGAADYYMEHGGVPPVGAAVSLASEPVDGRLAVQSDADEVIGFLPTKYNYLVACMAAGYSYAGQVVTSSSFGLPGVSVDLEPSE